MENSWTSKKLRLSINQRLINKNELQDNDAFINGWTNKLLTIDELAQSVKQGFAYCSELKGQRATNKFVASDIISADLDNVGDLKEVRNNPLVKDHATLIYTTHSHTKEAPKLRIVFALERTITDPIEMRAATRSLALRLSSDGSVVDPARLFFGSKGCEFAVADAGIDNEFLEELIQQGRNAQHFESSRSNRNSGIARSPLKFSSDLHVNTQNGTSVSVKDVTKSTSIHCPFHNDLSPSAFITENSKGQKGICCSTCGTTFWEKDAWESVDFFAFERAARSIKDHAKLSDDLDQMFFQAQTNSYLGQAGIFEFDRQYVESVDIQDGANFIKSPKGSGKTEFLKGITETSKNKSLRILLVGHRRSLIKQMCNRLGLVCYLDEADAMADPSVNRFQRYGVCLDSIAKVPNGLKYDYVFIDECEQVLSHLLSETMDNKRNHVFRKFQHLVSTAKRVVALDADLSEVSFNHISKWSRQHDPKRKSRLWINTYHQEKGNLFVFDKKNQLIGDISRSIAAGKRCYITSNSKNQIEALEKSIAKKHKSKKLISITSSTVAEKGPVFEFLNNPTEQALKYDVILTSPSVSTGVDITFPDGAIEIDTVYGIFEPLVLTHFECDQQLMRVRNPETTNVYIASRTYNFETNFDVVMEDILSLQMMDHLLDNYNFEGQPKYNRNNELHQIAASIISFQRASKNRLKKNFLDYKTSQGWNLVTQGEDEKVRKEGSILALEGKKLRDASALDAVLNARKITREELNMLEEKKDIEFSLSEDDQAAYIRGCIETFYRREISEELVRLDDNGRYRAAIRRLETLLNPEHMDLAESLHKTRRELNSDHEFLFPNEFTITKLIAECLAAAGLYQRGEFRMDHEVSKNELTDFVKLIGEQKTRYELVLKKSVPKDLHNKPTSTLGPLLKLVGLELGNSKPKTFKSKKSYIYKISKEAFDKASKVVEDRKIVPDN